MSENWSNAVRDPMDDELDRAIRAVLSISAPDEVRARVIDAAATWRRFPWVKACAVAAIVLILVGEVVYVRTIERNVVHHHHQGG
jgi:putative copper export protein